MANLKEYSNRLSLEGFLKSLMIGAIFGFSALFISALIFYLMEVPQLWWLAIIFIVVTAGITVLFYFIKYAPTEKGTAQRIDGLGLEERILTMTELKGKTDYISVRQREDATKALATVRAKAIKFIFPLWVLIVLPITGVLSLGMTTISVLAEHGVIDGGGEIIDDLNPPVTEYVYLEYDCTDGGNIVGEIAQEVVKGGDGFPVMAEPEDGYGFVMWSDGSTDPYRMDMEVQEDLYVFAVFMPADEGDGDGMPGEDGDGPPDAPKMDGEGNEFDPESDKNGGGGQYSPTNQIIDGETFYGDNIYDNAYEEIMDELLKNDEMSDELKQVIESYFGSIEQ